MLNFDVEFSALVQKFNNELSTFFEEYFKECPDILSQSMQYAVLDGGKRIRPVLCFATAKMLGVDVEEVVDYALAIEFIHSYSLVHDDLPAMDNDDYRRGKLSTHKKFGEAFGILAGDGLLNLAMEVSLRKKEHSFNDIKAMRVIFDYAGSKGMIKGQVLDLMGEKSTSISEDDLMQIHLNKTSKLITAPILVSSCMANGIYYEKLKDFGEKIGFMFQVTDDLLDVEGDFETIGKTPQKDDASNKLTSVKIYGVDGAKALAKKLYSECIEILLSIPNSQFLQEFTNKMYLRKK